MFYVRAILMNIFTELSGNFCISLQQIFAGHTRFTAVSYTHLISKAYGDLLPEGKVNHLEELRQDEANRIAFVGDGMNDAQVLALSHVGIAMGGLGSDAAIETADVVIQTDQPSKVAEAIKVGKLTRRIIWQNVSLAFGVKLLVLILGCLLYTSHLMI